MKKIAKILSIIILTVILISFASTNVFAGSEDGVEDPKKVNPSSITPTYKSDASGLKTTAQNIAGMIRNISAIAAVIIIMVLGVKYMLGSVEEKAEYKKSFMPLIIGIICVVAASTIAGFIFGMVETNT